MLKRAALTALVALALTSCQPAPIHHWTEATPEVQAAHAPAEIQAFIDAYWRQVWIDTTNYNRFMAWAVEHDRAVAAIPPCISGSQPRCSVDGVEVCNGIDLPTCGIVWRESRFDPHARNRSSSAGGLHQFIFSTFRSVCPEYASRYGNAAYAPVWVQAECARRLWDHGRGSGNWAQTR